MENEHCINRRASLKVHSSRSFFFFESEAQERLIYQMGPVRIRHSSHDFGWQSSHSVDLAGWQAKMASIEIWIP